MKNRLLFLILGLIGLISSAYGQSFSEFKSMLDNCGMSFNKPDGFIESQIVENGDMNYEYALKYPDEDFEVRYSIRPISYKHYASDTVKVQMENQKTFRNSQYQTILQAIIYNVTGGVLANVRAFDEDAVKNEFSADWGATTFVELKDSGFGKGFKYCMIVANHKNDVADAYYFYMVNSKDKFVDYAAPLFHSLRFD